MIVPLREKRAVGLEQARCSLKDQNLENVASREFVLLVLLIWLPKISERVSKHKT